MGASQGKSKNGSNANVIQPDSQGEKNNEGNQFQNTMHLMKGEKTAWMLERPEKFLEEYRIGMNIGYGSYGEVRVCQHIRTKNKRCVRILQKRLMDEATVNKFMTMTLLLQHLDHPNVLRFQEIY